MIGQKHILLALGLMFGGDLVLIPLVYSTKLGFVTVFELFALVLATEALTDVVWYAVGRSIGEERLYRIPYFKHKPHIIERTSDFFKSKDAQILFASKFVYGTRIITQVLCGAHRMSFPVYFSANIAGVVLWSSVLLGLVSVVNLSVSSLEDATHQLQASLAIFVLVVAAVSIAANRYLKGRLSRTS